MVISSKINQFVISTDKKAMEWNIGSEKVKITTECIQQGIVDNVQNYVFALLGTSDEAETLSVFNVNGEEIFEFIAPDGFIFSYLTTDKLGEVCVICITQKYESAGCDWFFSIDINKKSLIKAGRAY